MHVLWERDGPAWRRDIRVEWGEECVVGLYKYHFNEIVVIKRYFQEVV